MLDLCVRILCLEVNIISHLEFLIGKTVSFSGLPNKFIILHFILVKAVTNTDGSGQVILVPVIQCILDCYILFCLTGLYCVWVWSSCLFCGVFFVLYAHSICKCHLQG